MPARSLAAGLPENAFKYPSRDGLTHLHLPLEFLVIDIIFGILNTNIAISDCRRKPCYGPGGGLQWPVTSSPIFESIAPPHRGVGTRHLADSRAGAFVHSRD